MFTGIRENINPTIAAVATLLIIFTSGIDAGAGVVARPQDGECRIEVTSQSIALSARSAAGQ
jgi:hypothetical protein